MFFAPRLIALAAVATLATGAHAGISLIADGSLGGTADLSGLSGMLENGLDAANVLGGMGSGLAWAGGNTFLALPDRGPNATVYAAGASIDNTTSFIPRFNTVQLGLTASASGALPFTLTPTLTSTTLLYSPTALTYSATGTALLPNTANKFYFTGRSDNFDASQNSLNPNNARLDPEAIRVSADGKSVFVSDEYGPYVYQFDRATGARIKSFALPSNLGIATLSSTGATEISANTSSGRITNKGMEGLAITPDGKTLVGFMQSPLAQDGGDGGRANRLVQIDIATGATKEFAYDNHVDATNKNYNSSEILAVNDHQFLVLERDGKGLGDGSKAVLKQVYLIDTAGAADVSKLSGETALLAAAVKKTLFLDVKSALNAAGIKDADIPSKLEGLAFGQDVMVGGVLTHTLYIANDNDFSTAAGPNKFFVFGVTDADLAGFGASYVAQAVPEPETYALMLAGLGALGFVAKRKKRV
ncbi:esterase-like activity of phytase family protein [soil metagenome]